jgi:hypothetical protein
MPPRKKTTPSNKEEGATTRKTAVRRSRKTFDIDRTVSVDEVEKKKEIPVGFPEKPVQVQASSQSASLKVVELSQDGFLDDEETPGGILHIPIPISKDSGFIDNAFQRLKPEDLEATSSPPQPFDPEEMSVKSQNADLKSQDPIPIVAGFQPKKKMENTTLSQFFGITEDEQEETKESDETGLNDSQNHSHYVEEDFNEERVGKRTGDGFKQTAGYITPEDSFSIIWRSSEKKGAVLSGGNAACHWCCHGFDKKQVGVPMVYRRGKFWVHGNYCSYACAAAAILYDRSKWNYQPTESYSLLHLLYRKVHGQNVPTTFFLRPAPSRETLQLFGGPLTIDEFRGASYKEERQMECFTPPFVSLVSTVEEITIERSLPKKKVLFHTRFHQAGSSPEGASPHEPVGKNSVHAPEVDIQHQERKINPIWLGKGLGGSTS